MSEKSFSIKHTKSRKLLILSIFVIGIIIGFFCGYFTQKTKFVSNAYAIREKTNDFHFIHPLLAVGNLSDAPSPKFQNLYQEVSDFIKNNSEAGDKASVYYIDYGQDGRFAINENQPYVPSSLMKIVIMIAYLKKSEDNPNLLNTSMLYQANMQQALESVPFNSPTVLKVDNKYIVSDLINKMIIDSDNGAMNILADNIGDAYLSKVYLDLGLKKPTDDAPYSISAKDYSLFFRILYNSTYLDNDNSEKALSILTKAKFADGITFPLPKGTAVAHKFGEHVDGTDADHITDVELHDCGIVYLPNNPYFLCVMTHGTSLSKLEKLIQGISSLVYNNYLSLRK